MSPVVFSCALCGYVIFDVESPASSSWLQQFRALYSSPTGTWISGVGLYDDPRGGTWIAPSDYAGRWNDIGYDFPARDRLAVMEQAPLNGRHGIVFHAACWSLMQRFYHPEAVPLVRLLEVCESLPFSLRGTGVSWGHDYGGLVFLDGQNYYPWEDRVWEREEHSAQCQLARANPYATSDIQQLLLVPEQSPPTRRETNALEAIPKTRNCFADLPWELLEAIAILLPTVDALRLRQACAAFADLFSSQRFWASRFRANAERGYLFELRIPEEHRDWRWLYRLTNNASSPAGLTNRRRIWGLIRSLRDVLAMQWNDPLPPSSREHDPIGLTWKEITGDVLTERSATTHFQGFHEGCRLFKKVRILIPEDLWGVAFCISGNSGIEYVTGMRLIRSQGAEIRLGYCERGKEQILEVKVLKGLILAVGSRGVQALQVITGEGKASRWFGCPDESPKTRRLAYFRSITALEAAFDGFKMIGLRAAERVASDNSLPLEQRGSFRDIALWYPNIPESNLHLNEASFTGENPLAAKYRPLFWVHFGGPGGIYLQHVIGISALVLGSLCSIEFHYNTEKISTASRSLGRQKETEFSSVIRFSMDGPGGERIETVEVGFEFLQPKQEKSCPNYGKCISFRIRTNRGRCFHFQSREDSSNAPPLKQLAIIAGTAVTGFYASQRPDGGILSFGVISERLVQETIAAEKGTNKETATHL